MCSTEIMKLFLHSLLLFIPLFCIAETTVEEPPPGTKPKISRSLLITGCSRSGAIYTTRLLRGSGLDINNEFMGSYGTVSWLMAADVNWMPWGPLSQRYQFDHIFHQVRDPIKVIQSLYNEPPNAIWNWIAYAIPKINSWDSLLTKCAKYWYYWNLMAEAKAEWTYRVEDLDFVYVEIERRLRIAIDTKVLASLSKTTNTREPCQTTITWTMLKNELDFDLYENIYNLAIRYGYKP